MTAVQLTSWLAALFASSSLFAHDVALRLVLLALALACAATAAVRQRSELSLLPPVAWPFLAWAIWAALAVSWSIEPGRSEKEFWNEILYVGAAFSVCYVGAQAPRASRIGASVVGAGAALLCAVAVYAYSQGIDAYLHGWHGGPGDLSSALLMAMPCAMAGAWYSYRIGSRKGMVLAVLLTAAMLVAAYTTLNRTIWAGIAIQFLLVGAFAFARMAPRTSRRMWSGAAVVGLSVVAGCALIAMHVQEERVEADPAAVLGKDLRARIWPEVVERIAAAPLTGYGFGRGLFRHALTDEFQNGLIWHAHNLFLDTALQTGLPGLLLFLLLLAVVAREGWGAARASDDAIAAYGIALLGLLTGMVVRNMTDTMLVRQNALFFWAVAGFLIGSIRAGRPSPAR